jgi:meiotically up-regulated gene 157 (Mug157) protein
LNRRELILGSAAAAVAQSLPAQATNSPFTGLAGRPPEATRRFRSPVIERTIADMRKAVTSPELAQLFENCFPNTLDTTVFAGTYQGKPDTYVITGDIDAMWLRDSSAQVWPYLQFAREDLEIANLLEGVIRRQARLIQLDSYANAFTRDPTDPPLSWSVHDKTDMRPGVGERKWEIDSLCYPVRLAYSFWKVTGSRSPFDAEWMKAAKRIVATFREQQRTTGSGPYHFQRAAANPTDTLPMHGYGNPVRPNGLICSSFRPSDDACIYPLFIPANLFAAVTLDHIAKISSGLYSDTAFANECSAFAKQVRAAVMQHGIVHHPDHGEILAYEIDGFGNTLSMDDANAPGLVSLAYLELLPETDPLYQRTRAFALSPANPYFYRGTAGEGIGGPHIGLDYIWPMSILLRAMTSTSDAEIVACLRTLSTTTAGTNFMHESFHKDDPAKYTRPWFAWANGLFGELLLKLRAERPTLLRNFTTRT